MANRLGNLETRVLSGMVLGGPVLVIVHVGGVLFALLVLIGSLVAVREWVRLVGAGGADIAQELSYGFLTAALVVGLIGGPLVAIVLLAVSSAALLLVLGGGRCRNSDWVALGILYVGVAAAATLWLRNVPEIGRSLVYWLCFTVWATDTAAYAAGRLIGGPKLAPSISPNKTWAGVAGGVVAAGVVSLAVAVIAEAARPALAGLAGMVLSILAQAGDLFESAIKRRFGAKDASRLIPGHGGMLDRMDGFIAAAPALALYQATVGRAIGWW